MIAQDRFKEAAARVRQRLEERGEEVPTGAPIGTPVFTAPQPATVLDRARMVGAMHSPKGPMEGVTEGGVLEAVPYLNILSEFSPKQDGLRTAIEAVQDGTANQEQFNRVLDWEIDRGKPGDVLYHAARVIKQTIPFGVELATTGGWYTAGRIATMKTFGKLVGKGLAGGKLRKAAGAVGGVIAQQTAIGTAKAAITKAATGSWGGPDDAEAMRRALPEFGIDASDDGRLQLVMKRVGAAMGDKKYAARMSNFYELATERMGPTLSKILQKFPVGRQVVLLEQAMFKWMRGKNYSKNLDELLAATGQKAQVHSLLEEFLEEVSADVIKGATPGMEDQVGDSFQSLEQVFGMVLGLAAPGAARAGLARAAGPNAEDVERTLKKVTARQRLEEVLNQRREPSEPQTAPGAQGDVAARAIERIRTEVGVEVEAAEVPREGESARIHERAAELGIDVAGFTGDPAAPSGYQAGEGVILVNVDYLEDKEYVDSILAHEALHDMGSKRRELLDESLKLVADWDPVGLEEKLAEARAARGQYNQDISPGLQAEEAGAHYAQSVNGLVDYLGTDKGKEFLAELYTNDRTLFQKLADAVRELVRRIGIKLPTKDQKVVEALAEAAGIEGLTVEQVQAADVLARAFAAIKEASFLPPSMRPTVEGPGAAAAVTAPGVPDLAVEPAPVEQAPPAPEPGPAAPSTRAPGIVSGDVQPETTTPSALTPAQQKRQRQKARRAEKKAREAKAAGEVAQAGEIERQVKKTATPTPRRPAGETAAERAARMFDEGEEDPGRFAMRPPGLSAIEPHLTEAERGKLRKNTSTKLREMFGQLPPDADFAAAAKAGAAKKGWYEDSTKAILEVFGEEDAPRFVALLAAMSPQTSVEANLYNALNTWVNWVAAGRPTKRVDILRVMGRSVQGSKGEKSVLGAWRNNAYRALRAEDPAAVVLSGPKVNSFARNLIGKMGEVTNDAWMANFSLVDQTIFSGSLNVAGTDPGKTPGYLAMNAKVRRVAKALTKETGEEWTPAHVQETVWSWAKTAYELSQAADEKRTVRQLVEDGAITDEAIAETPDFGGLFLSDTTIRSILERAGYGTALQAFEEAYEPGAPRAGGTAETGSGPERTAPAPGLVRAAARLDRLADQRRRAAESAAGPRSIRGAQVAQRVGEHAYELADEPKSRRLYARAMREFVRGNPWHASVTLKKPKELEGSRLFLTDDGKAGVYVTPSGEIGGLFSTNGRGLDLMDSVLDSLEPGAVWAESFATALPNFYVALGMRPVSRMAFVEKFAPDAWDYEQYGQWQNGRPDILHYAFTKEEGPAWTDEQREALPLADTWEESVAIAQRAAEPELAGAGRFALAPPVDSPAFKKWFGRSKVRNYDRTPKVVYRGTQRPGEVTKGIGIPPSFTDFPDIASTYAATPGDIWSSRPATYGRGASVAPVYLSIQNPLYLGEEAPEFLFSEYLEHMQFGEERGMTEEEAMKALNYLVNRERGKTKSKGEFRHELPDEYDPGFSFTATPLSEYRDAFEYDGDRIADDMMVDVFVLADAPVTRRVAKRLGYDGIIHLDVFAGRYDAAALTGKAPEEVEGLEEWISSYQDMDLEDTHYTYRPFSPTQIKSATGNRGTFDPENPDIRMAARPPSPVTVDAGGRMAPGEERAAAEGEKVLESDPSLKLNVPDKDIPGLDSKRSLDDFYEQWISARQLSIEWAEKEAARNERELLATLPKRSKAKILRDAARTADVVPQRFRDLDEAIHLYIDLGPNAETEHAKFGEDLTERQQELYRLSQALPADVKVLADRIAEENMRRGEMLVEAGVIGAVRENYTKRKWISEEEDPNRPIPPGKVAAFKTGSESAKHRTYSSILQGWAEERELALPGAIGAQRAHRVETAQVMHDRNVLKVGEKAGVISHAQHDDWEEVNHPNFTKWLPIGKSHLKRDGEFQDTRTKNTFVDEEGTIWQRVPLYAPPHLAKKLNNVLGKSWFQGKPFWGTVSRWNAILKATVLFTSLFHHQAFLRSYMYGTPFEGEGLVKGTGKALNWKKAYQAGQQAIDNWGAQVQELVRAGLTLQRNRDIDEVALREKTRIGELIDKVAGAREVKNVLVALRDHQTNFLFHRMGPHFKVQSALLEYRHLLKKHEKAIEDGVVTRAQVAKIAADTANDDFGGLNLEREARSKTQQQILRFLLLAPDWTESNVRSMVAAVGGGSEGGMKGWDPRGDKAKAYRALWGRVILRAGAATILFNLLMSGMDDDERDPDGKSFWTRYKRSWDEGRMRYLEADITPLYRLMGGGDPKRKYFSVLGHFRDPIKFVMHPVRSAKHKVSILGGMVMELFEGSDWMGRPYTNFSEILGFDEKGEYKTSRRNEDGEWEYRKGDPKGGRISGQTVSWRSEEGRGPIGISQVPSYILNQTRGAMPIQVQNMTAFIAGEIDAFDAISKSLGMMTATTREQDFDSRMGALRKELNNATNRDDRRHIRQQITKLNQWAAKVRRQGGTP